MTTTTVGSRRRGIRILRLFFGLVLSFFAQYFRARLSGRSYDFFADSGSNRRRAVKIRETALAMGGVLIKVGQFLSSRVDLLPSEYIEELALLQDEVPGVPFAEIRAMVEIELGAPLDNLFANFETEALAAASLGQVHRAALHTGEQVAVKVQRPRIADVVEADLRTIRWIVGWLDRRTPLSRRVDLPLILREFEDTLRLELDYVKEGHHAERAALLFQDNPQIAVPRIYWSHSTTRVLTMRYIAGTKVTDFEELERQHISRGAVAEILMRAYLRQILQAGFFHADPHPGNIFVRPGPVVVLLDFGMVGEILPQTRENLRGVFIGIMRRDYDQVLVALKRLGFLTRTADTQTIKRALAWTVESFYELSFGELKAIDPREVIDQLQGVLFAEYFRIPANYAFLGRALGTLSGLCTALDPSFQFVTVAEPYARDLVRQERGFRGAIALFAGEARALATSAYRLPFLTQTALETVQNGDLDFRREVTEVVRAVDRVERSLRRGWHALLVIGFLIAGTLVVRTQYTAIGVLLLGAALIFLLRALGPFSRRRARW